jgi:hypothetical protein
MDLVIFNIVSSVNWQEAVTKLIPASRCSKVLLWWSRNVVVLAGSPEENTILSCYVKMHKSSWAEFCWCNGAMDHWYNWF